MAQPPISPLLLEKYLQNQCTDLEKEMVESWYATLRGTPDFLDKLPEQNQSHLQTDTFRKIRGQIDVDEQPVIRKFPWGWLTGIAASVIFVLGLYLQFNRQRTAPVSIAELVQSKGEDKIVHFTNKEQRIVNHKLPDGSTVMMHTDASITYPKAFDSDKRLVTFSGEGFFNIQKDKSRPFSIQSDEMVIRVLGTSFNVKAPAKTKVFQISVLTGSVEVTAPDRQRKDQQVVLKPQQQVLFEIQSKRLIVSTIPALSKKEIYQPVTVTFRDTPLTDVLSQLQKKFNVAISLTNPKMGTCLVNADFEQQPLPLIMEMLCTTLDATYTMSEKTIRVNGLACE